MALSKAIMCCKIKFGIIFVALLLYCRNDVAAFQSPSVNSGVNSSDKTLQVEIITLALMHPTLQSGIPFTGPAFDMADEDLRSKYRFINFTHTYLFDKRFSSCTDWAAESDRIVAEYFYTRKAIPDVTAFISSGCFDVYGLAPLAKEWNIIMITSAIAPQKLRDKSLNPTAVCLKATSDSMKEILYLNFLRRFGWSSVFFVGEAETNQFWVPQGQDIRTYLNPSRGIQSDLVIIRPSLGIDYVKLLRQFSQRSRVCLYFGHSTYLRILLVEAAKLNMTNGEYVYLGYIPYRSDAFGNFTWKFNDQDDEIARDAFRSLMLLEPGQDAIYSQTMDRLTDKWRESSSKNYSYTYGPRQVVSAIVASSYAAMMIFGQVINELSQMDFDFSDGSKLVRKFYNRTFTVKTGEVFIDDAGERLPNLAISDMNKTTGEFQIAFLQTGQNLEEMLEFWPVDWPGEQPPPNEPKCGFQHQSPLSDINVTSGISAGAVAILLATTAWMIFTIKRTMYEKSVSDMWWKISRSELSKKEASELRASLDERTYNARSATYRNERVWISPVLNANCDLAYHFGNSCGPGSATVNVQRETLVFLKELNELSCLNINKFVGISSLWTNAKTVDFISAFCEKGSLDALIIALTLDWEFQLSFIRDFLNGITFIHKSSLKCHGNLTISKCLIDSRFTLKINKTGYRNLRKLIYPEEKSDLCSTMSKKHFYMAPEILRNEALPSATTDVYSAGIIINHIMTLEDPYSEYLDSGLGTLEQTIGFVCNQNLHPSFRPRMTTDDHAVPFLAVIERCWDALPDRRVNLEFLNSKISEVVKGSMPERKYNMVERVLARLEWYSDELDKQVDDRTQDLIREMHKSDHLLREILPRDIVVKLRAGEAVQPEAFHQSTIFFSQVGGFTALLYTATSSNVVTFLNSVYTMFDHVCNQFDVYKVETIADSYMVASGLPVQNGDNHIKEICAFALALMNVYQPFVVTTSTSLRIGINSGSCAAGVVGLKAPRYCLFGDTVNTASRMLMMAEDHKIHLSKTAAELLSCFPGFITVERGLIHVKGKGHMFTYWLEKYINNANGDVVTMKN